MSVAELARRLDAKPETIGARLRSLRRNGIISFTAVPTTAGSAVALVTVRPGAVGHVIESLSALQEVRMVVETIGRPFVLTELAFCEAAHVSELVNRQIGSIDGVVGVEVMMVLSIAKDRPATAAAL